MIKELIAKAVQDAVVDMSEDVMLLVRQIEGLYFKDDELFITFDDGTANKVKGVSKSELMGEIGLAGDSIEDLYFEGEYLYYKLDDGKPKKVKGFKKSDFQGKDGKDGVNGKDGRDGKDGKDGKDSTLNKKEYVKIAENEVNIHNKEFDHELLHDSHLVGTKEVDESNIDDGKVLVYNKKKNKIVYDSIQQFTQRLSPFRAGYQLPSQEGQTGKVLTSNGSSGSETWETPSGGGGTPAGSSGQLQFNNAGAFGADANLFWDDTNNRLGIGTASPSVLFTVQGPGTAGTSIARFNPASGNSYVRINDNGTMIIDSDVSTGTIPLSVRYNGTEQVRFSYQSMSIGNVGTYPVGFGGGHGSLSTASGDFKIGGYTDITLRPNSASGGSGSGSVIVIGGAAASKVFIVRGAASQTANLQEWQNSAGTALTTISSAGVITSTTPNFHNLGGSLVGSDGTWGARWKWSGGGEGIGMAAAALLPASSTPFMSLGEYGYSGWTYLFLAESAATGIRLLSSSSALHIKNAANSSFAPLICGSSSASVVGLTVKGAASQTANLQEWQNSAGNVGARVTSSGDFSHNSGYGESEKFGRAAVADDYSVAFGSNAQAPSNYSVAIGRSAYASANSIAIGNLAGTPSTSGGVPANPGFTGYIVLNATGNYLAPTANNQLIIAGPTEAYFGKGVTSTSPGTMAINATGGSGTDVAGASLTIAGGKATGNAAGGDLIFQTSDSGSTGTTLQSLTTKAIIKATGNVGIGTASPGAQLQVNTGAAGTIGTIIKAAASQTANLQEWQNSAGTVLTKVAADGGLTVSTGLSINNYVTIAGGANPYVSLNTNSGGNKITILGDSTGSGGRGECRLSSDSIITYSNSATSSAGADTGLSRNAAGILEVNNGTAGTYRDLKVRDIISSGIVSSNRFRGAVSTETSNATPSINIDNVSAHSITALAADITSVTITGTPSNFDKLLIRILDNGTARAITWGSSFEAKGVALPTTTVISKVLTVGFIYDTVTSKWGCVASVQEV